VGHSSAAHVHIVERVQVAVDQGDRQTEVTIRYVRRDHGAFSDGVGRADRAKRVRCEVGHRVLHVHRGLFGQSDMARSASAVIISDEFTSVLDLRSALPRPYLRDRSRAYAARAAVR
jgi:hypothetical protein